MTARDGLLGFSLDEWSAHLSENRRSLPKTRPLPGSLHADYRRCGKSNCRCVRGELHGPYFRRHQWKNGRQRWRYVPAAKVEKVRAGIERWRELHPPTWKMRRLFRDLMREAKAIFGP